MHKIQIFDSEEFGKIRTVVIDDEPWFVGKDVALALGYERTADAIRQHVEAEDKGVGKIQTPGGMQNMTFINESGLYALIFGSKLESAKRFKHWVTSEVLPSIRKTGTYHHNEKYDDMSQNLKFLKGILDQMVQKELEDKERDRKIALVKETAEKAVETTEKIKDEFIQEFDNWRNDVNTKVREIAINSGIPYQTLFSEIYSELERRAGADLSARQRNKRTRMINNGSRKSDIEKETTKIAIVEEDKKLKQIFDDIVRRYAVKYIA